MTRRTPAMLLAAMALGACSKPAAPPAAPASVAVGTQPVTRGSQPELMTAYGSARPAPDASQTISLQQTGQVTRLAVVTGSAVRAGQSLATFAIAPASLSAYEQARTALDAAQAQRDTTAQLLDQRLATQDQMQQAGKAVTDARAALAALRQEGADQPLRELKAPFDGIVTALGVAQGDRTAPGVPIVTVARLGGVIASVGVDPATRARVRPGQAARLYVLDGGEAIGGKVLRVDGQLNAASHLVDVDIAFAAGALLPNQPVRAEIEVGAVQGWIVPHEAVVTAAGPAQVFQLLNGKAKAVAVTVSLTGAKVDVVEGTLDAAQPLIVSGAYQVHDGQDVRTGTP